MKTFKCSLTDLRVKRVSEPFPVTAYNTNEDDMSDFDSFNQTLKDAFYKLLETIDNLKLTNVIKTPIVPRQIPSPSKYSHIKIAPYLNICGIN